MRESELESREQPAVVNRVPSAFNAAMYAAFGVFDCLRLFERECRKSVDSASDDRGGEVAKGGEGGGGRKKRKEKKKKIGICISPQFRRRNYVIAPGRTCNLRWA